MKRGSLGASVTICNDREWLYNGDTMKYLQSLVRFEKSEVAKVRHNILTFCGKHGSTATMDAYGVSRRTLFRWKKLLRDSYGRLERLVPESRAPHKRRQTMTHYKVVAFIRHIREQVPHLGKEKIKPLLDEYCQEAGIPTISISTIGKVIKRYNLTIQSKRIYHDPGSWFAKRKIRYKTKVKRSPRGVTPGYVEIDTIHTFIEGMKLYVFNALDVTLKFQFSFGYSTLTSRNARDFYQRLEKVYPLQKIHTVQTDNGLEYMGEFHQYLTEQNLHHLFIYPRCPKINGFVERANRTLQEEFVEQYIHTKWQGLVFFNRDLMEYLVWYNTKRVHKSLGNITPMDYLLLSYPKECHMYGTHTSC